MRNILFILLIFEMLGFLFLTGCEGAIQNQPDDKVVSTTVSPGKTDTLPEKTDALNETIPTDKPDDSNDTIPPDETPIAEIMLDKTYYNERFKFKVSYPGIWSLVEEEDNPSLPDQGIIIFIDNDKVTSIDYQNINKENHIRIYGQGSPKNISEQGMTISEFITDDGIKGKSYFFINVNGMLYTHIVLDEYPRNAYFGARICVSKEINDKYGDVITRILKSIKLP